MSIAKSLDVDRRSFLTSRRSKLFSGTALAGMLSAGVFFAPVAVQPSMAANECNPVGSGSNYIVACGQGDPEFYTSIVYGNAQTNPADSTLFKFNGTQAVGGGIFDRNAVFISSNKDGHTIGIQVLEDGGNVPNFAATNPAAGDATAFRAQTQNNNSALSFEVDGGIFTGGSILGLGTTHGVALTTSGSNSALTIDLTNATFTGGDAEGISDVSGFYASTSGPGSGISFTADTSTFTSGDLWAVGPANGVILATTGSNAGIDIDLTDVTVHGGEADGASNVTGFAASTTGDGSTVGFVMDGGTINGGYVDAAGIGHGVSIGTTGANAGVNFDLQGGTINGGTAGVLAATHGVNIATTGAGSNITFETGVGSSIVATEGNAVNLIANNADILAGDTINGSLYSDQMIAGVGTGTGFFATAGGVGNTNIHVGLTGDVGGTGAGLIGTTTGTGSVDILVEGNVYQDENDALPLNLLLPVGVGGVAFGSGNVTIETTADSTVSQVGANPVGNVEGAGVLGVAYGAGNVEVTANGSVSATGIGVGGIALGGGDAHVDIGGDIAVDNSVNGGISPLGALGIAGLGDGTVGGLAVSGSGAATVHLNGAILGNTPDIGLAALVVSGTEDATVGIGPRMDGTGPSEVNANVLGVAAINLGSGDAVITEEPSYDPITDSYFYNTVNSDGMGVLGLAQNGNVSIETGHVYAGSAGGILGYDGGVVGVALNGDVDITTFGDTTATGPVGVFGLAPNGDVDIDLRERTVATVNGDGVVAIAGETADVEGRDSTVNSDGTGIFALGTDAYVDSGTINSANGSGVIAVALGGDADVDTYGKITADNGLFGAAAFSFGGDATVTVRNDIDPPAIGVSAFTFGPGTATVNVLGGNLVEADLVGVATTNIGTGDVVVSIGSNATIDSAGIGIATGNFGFGGNTTIDIASGAAVYGDENAISVAHFSPDGPAVINNAGLVQGNDASSAVIEAVTSSGLQINNTGVIRGNLTAAGNPFGAFESIVESFGGPTEINNAGEMYGNVTLVDFSGTGNTINNTGYWETGGTNTLVSGTGNDRIVNTGIIDANLFTVFDVDNFDNDGGLLTTTSGTPGDLTIISGNFNGSASLAGGSMLALDAELAPGGIADLLVVDEDVTGVTLLDVNDLAGGPGQYDPDGVLFAMVGGATDTSNFTTDGGIDKGLFRYDAYLRDTPQNGIGYEEWVLASTLDREAYEFPVLAYGAQNLWYSSTGTWLDRTADLRAGFHGTEEIFVDLKNEGASAPLPSRTGPGIWARVFGGHNERDMSNTSAPVGLSGPSYLYEDSLRQRHVGVMAGVDYATDGVSHDGHGQTWIFGLMGGYTASDLDFQTSATSAEFKQGSVGGYVSYLHGGFHADLAVKADFGKMDYSFNDGNFSERVDANYRSVGVMLDTGYRFDMHNGWFVEPKASLAYVHTSFDDMVVLGTGVDIENAKSLRGRLGARVGGSFVSNGSIVEPYVELSVWNEFQGDHVATLGSNGLLVPVGYDTSGTFGEGVVGASLLNMENGWSVYGKGTVQFGGDGMLGYAGNVGFRKSW